MKEIQPSSRIGVFDSGVGGLTVLREIYRQLPKESILYLADNERLPYGNRSQEEILSFVRQILNWMVEQEVKMAIMACNTSSALALDIVRCEFDLPILGLILPGARAAVELGGQSIGIIATNATVKSNAYPNAIQEIEPTVKVWQVSCPEFVLLIEQNRLLEPYTRQVAKKYLAPLIEKQIDTLVYGCTHYPLLGNVLREILSPSVKIIDPAQYVVAAAEQELELMGLRNQSPPLPTRFFVSGSIEQFAQLSQHWIGCVPIVEKVHFGESSTSAMTLETID
jgi:glutamate racemase